MPGFMFATGIENSNPLIRSGARIDQMEKCGHYQHWRTDLELVASMGIHYLRWGPPIHMTFLAPGKYEWSWAEAVLAKMHQLQIEPILDLCHFGLPDWLGNFQNREFPYYFAEYAKSFSLKFPFIKCWTPINEMLITALFSAKYGWWNECQTSDEAYVRATLNIGRANRLAMRGILESNHEAIFIHSESSEYTHPSGPEQMPLAHFLNERRFLPLDLCYGKCVCAHIFRYLLDNGMDAKEYDFFSSSMYKYRCILGTDYYLLNEHLLRPDGTTTSSGEFFGYYVIAKQYYERYGLPLMHTETNIKEEEGAAKWLWKEWNSMLRLRADGVPIVGFTWYSLTDQIDWDIALREERNNVNSVGLFDLERNIRIVGEHYKMLIEKWRELLPAGSSALSLV